MLVNNNDEILYRNVFGVKSCKSLEFDENVSSFVMTIELK